MSSSKPNSTPAASSKQGDDGSGDHNSTPSKPQHTSVAASSQHNKTEPGRASELHSSNNTTASASSSAHASKPAKPAKPATGTATVSASSNPKLAKTGNNAGASGKSSKDEDDEAKTHSGNPVSTAGTAGTATPHQSTDPHATAKPPSYGAGSGDNRQTGASKAVVAGSEAAAGRALGSGGAAFGKDEKVASGDRLKREAIQTGSKEAKGSLGGVGAHAASASTVKQYNTPQVKSKL